MFGDILCQQCAHVMDAVVVQRCICTSLLRARAPDVHICTRLCACIGIYLLYASFEEQHGLARHAMKVYERATDAVPRNERNAVWKLYIARVSATFGVTYSRDLYSKVSPQIIFFCSCILVICPPDPCFFRIRFPGMYTWVMRFA